MSAAATPAVSPAPGRRETLVALLVAGLVLLVNLLTAERSPTVWLDEVSYADPAVNLLMGNGFTSTAWYGQTGGEFWAGNVPLHALGLAGWLKVWGVGMVPVRAFNYVCAVLAALLLWRAVSVSGWLRSPAARLGLLGLALSGFGLCHAYRSGRPDALLLLIFAVLVHTHATRRGWPRLAGLFLGAFLVPWTGLQALPLLAVTGVFLLLWFGRSGRADVAALASGSAAGLAALLLLYDSQGVLHGFLGSILPHTALSENLPPAEVLWGKLRGATALLTDLSLVLLAAGSAGAVAFLALRRGLSPAVLTPARRGLLFAITAGFSVYALGKFPLFYSWMIYLPAALAWAFLLDAAPPSQAGPRRLLLFSCALAILAGLPLRLGFIVKGWQERDYAPVRRLVSENLRPDDTAYVSFQAYYPAKALARETFVNSYARAITAAEKARVTCLVIAPADFAETARLLGGRWTPTGAAVSPAARDSLGARPYDLAVWRREP